MAESTIISREPMLEMFIFETVQLVEQLEDILIESEKSNQISPASVNEVFRIMHTIKGAAAMMMYDNIARLTHATEDLFSTIRAAREPRIDCVRLTDIVLRVSDFIKGEVAKIEEGQEPDANPDNLIEQVKAYVVSPAKADPAPAAAAAPVAASKVAASPVAASIAEPEPIFGELHSYAARIFFEEGCQMENMRAFTVVHSLMPHVHEMWYEPADIADNEASSDIIRETGFHIYFTSEESQEVLYACLDQTLFLERLEFEATEPASAAKPGLASPALAVDAYPAISTPSASPAISAVTATADLETATAADIADVAALAGRAEPTKAVQSIISVNINKLDTLMDLVGELVIAEAMVTRNPELEGLQLDGFHKSVRQLNKLTTELQDIAMSIRMIPIAATFHKMQRIVRDMNRKLGKDVELVVAGEETEVDKNIIDSLSDPLMHLIRNSLDHGIESPAERLAAGKPEKGTVLLEAKNSGGDVWITIKDDGRGLDKAKILKKAAQQGLLIKPEADYTDKEIFNFILLPGFSTKDKVSEFSGRGVGMDVVRENINKINGTISMDSAQGRGTTIQIRIPLTLAIINGMLIEVRDTRFIVPTTSIREVFRVDGRQVIRDTEGNEMMMIRGQVYSLCRLHTHFRITARTEELSEGIIIVVEDGDSTLCLFADALIGEQQVVVKPMPAYLKKNPSLAGCTILGDGSISLILDISGLVKTH